MYKILIAISVFFLIIEIVKKPKRMKLKSKVITPDNKILKLIDKIIKKHETLYNLKEKYITNLSIIIQKDRVTCNKYILFHILISAIITAIVCMILSSIFTMWYAIFIISIASFYILVYSGIVYVKIKINKIYTQFPTALQAFTDEYITNKNIKSAIDKSYGKMPGEIGAVFEMLSRELSSGKEYKKPILKLASNLSYIWGYSFAETLIMSYEGIGDISEELLYLSTLVNEEITAEEETKTEQAGNKMIFITLNILTLVMFIINMVVNDLSKHLYFYTSTGNSIMMAWLLIVIGGVTIINLMEKI